MENLELFPKDTLGTTKAMFINFGQKEEAYCLPILGRLRQAGINAEIFPDSSKMKKQMNYANKKNIPFVIMAGESEIEEKVVSLKDMTSGEQFKVTVEELINKIK